LLQKLQVAEFLLTLLKNKEMKKRVLLLLFIAVTNLLSAQYHNKKLHKIFDSGAFEISIPNEWKEITPTYPYYWVKEFKLKDSSFNSYFKIAQYRIKDSKNNSLEDIVRNKVERYKKSKHREFSFAIEKKNINSHLVLKTTSWRKWYKKRSKIKHTTEFLKKGDDLYVFWYVDSTKTSVKFENQINRVISSLKRIKSFNKGPYIRIYKRSGFQVSFMSDWKAGKIKGKSIINSILFNDVQHNDTPAFSVESEYFVLKNDMSLKELESLIIYKDEWLKNYIELKSRVTEEFIEFTGIWKSNIPGGRKKIIRYFKNKTKIVKVTYSNNTRYFNKYTKERKLFFGSFKLNNEL